MSNTSSTESTLQFNSTMEVIDTLYNFQATGFTNGSLRNEAGENNGSCKLFSFAKLHNFSEQQTLACFGEYYRGVLATPNENDHQNIRNFMKTGWAGISFDAAALSEK